MIAKIMYQGRFSPCKVVGFPIRQELSFQTKENVFFAKDIPEQVFTDLNTGWIEAVLAVVTGNEAKIAFRYSDRQTVIEHIAIRNLMDKYSGKKLVV